MRNLTLTIQFCDISESFVSATKYENTSNSSNQTFLVDVFITRFCVQATENVSHHRYTPKFQKFDTDGTGV
jgi:hypothetical protein